MRRMLVKGIVVAAAVALVLPAAAASAAPASASPASTSPASAGPPVPRIGVSEPAAADLPSPPSTDRIAGPDRFETALAISRTAYPDGAPVVYVVSGGGYPDALSAGPAAAEQGGPLLLTATRALPAAVADEIARLAPREIVVVGGPQSVAASVVDALTALAPTVTRIQGADRYATSIALADTVFAAGAETVYVATGRTFPDALSAGAAAGSRGAPVVLVDGAAAALVGRLGVDRVVIAGGPASVTPALEEALAGLASTTRQGGADRYAASTALNIDAFDASERAFLVTGVDYADALAGSAWAGLLGAPLYTVPGDCVPGPTLDALSQQGVRQVTLLGGPNTLREAVETLTACEAKPETAPVRVPLSCDTALGESVAEALVGTDLAPGALPLNDPLKSADDRTGSLTCRWTAPQSSGTRTPQATLTVVPDVSTEDYRASSRGVDYGGYPPIPGFDPESREACDPTPDRRVCGLIAPIDGYGVRLTVTPAAQAVTEESRAATRRVFADVAAQLSAAGEPGPLWNPVGTDLAGVSDCDGLITTEQLGEIVGDSDIHEYRVSEGEFALATFRSNSQVGGYGCAWSTLTGPAGWRASVLPGGAAYFAGSTPVTGGDWHAATGYPGEAYLSEAGDQVSVLVDNAWFSIQTSPDQVAVLPELAAAVVENVRAAG